MSDPMVSKLNRLIRVRVPAPGAMHEGGELGTVRANLEDMPEVRDWVWPF